MPAFNFLDCFAADVEAGVKRQTIRSRRKNRPRVRETAYLFTGMRSQACRRLGEHKIMRVTEIRVEADGMILLRGTGRHAESDFFPLIGEGRDSFAQKDGFISAGELVDWIRKQHGLPFEGDVISW